MEELLLPDCQGNVCDVIMPSPRYRGVTGRAVSELGTFPVTFRYSNKVLGKVLPILHVLQLEVGVSGVGIAK